MQNVSFSDRLRYEFDNTMAKGPIALIGWLGLLSLALIVVISLIVKLFGIDPSNRGFFDLAWAGLMRTLDAGTMGGDTGSWFYLFMMLLTTLGGIFVVSTLIGVLSSGLEGKLDELRKGRSLVVEQNHTIILGWSPHIFTLISELVLANQNQKRPCIAILAEHDVVEMQDEIASKVGSLGNTRIVYRTGTPIDIADLKIVNPGAARSIIILPPEDENPDAYVIKTILALTSRGDAASTPYHVTTFLRDEKNVTVARMVGRDEVQLVSASSLIARITAQTCRQSGLSVAYTELLDFGGDEIYFKEEPMVAGKNFGEVLNAYEDSAVIGLRFKDGRTQLNPPMETRLEVGDKLIAISADDDTIRLSLGKAPAIDTQAIRHAAAHESKAERTLMLGWNQRAPAIITELDNYVGKDSVVKIVAASDMIMNGVGEHRIDGTRYKKLHLERLMGDVTDRDTLDSLAIENYDHVIVLSEATESANDAQQIDARTLITLLHLRDIADHTGNRFSIVSEMLDICNRELAHVTRADDFVVSDKLISLMLSQISENKELAPVLEDLFDPDGSELYFKPASDYIAMETPVNFYTVVEAARQRGEVAIGYRLQRQAFDAEKSFGVKLNPVKSEKVSFCPEDKIIVLAEQ